MVTVREIAKIANVSITTVSRVLNGKPGVGDDVRKQVLDTAESYGYQPTKRTKLSSSMVTHLVSLVRPLSGRLSADPFYSDILHSLEVFTHEQNINLSFNTLDIAQDRMRSIPASLNDHRISGACLIGAIPKEAIDHLLQRVSLPVVLVDNYYPDRPWDSVMIDNERGMILGVEHLIKLGHRSITLVGGPAHQSILEREKGYINTMERHHLKTQIIPSDDLTPVDGEKAIEQLVRAGSEATAIVCSNDSQAAGVLRRLQGLGIRVPEDISVFGFDDDNTAPFTSPALTTIHVDRTALGQIAGQLLLGRIQNPGRYPVRAVAGVGIVERKTVGKPRDNEGSIFAFGKTTR